MAAAGDARRARSRRWFAEAVSERLGYKAAAIFFAFVLWLVVSVEEPSEELVPVRLVTLHDSARVLAGERPVVRALVVGRARELIKLYETPPTIRRSIPDDAPEVVRVDLRPGDVYLPIGVEASVRDVQPRAVNLAFDVSISRRVPVVSTLRLRIDSAAGLVGTTRIEPESVTVSGRRDLVSRVSAVRTVSGEMILADTMPHEVALDTVGLRVTVRPGRVAVRLRGRPFQATPPAPALVDSVTAAPVDTGRAARRDSVRRDSVRRDSLRRDSVRRDSARRPLRATTRARARDTLTRTPRQS